jgi:hypothetical protein
MAALAAPIFLVRLPFEPLFIRTGILRRYYLMKKNKLRVKNSGDVPANMKGSINKLSVL